MPFSLLNICEILNNRFDRGLLTISEIFKYHRPHDMMCLFLTNLSLVGFGSILWPKKRLGRLA